jgi:type II secretory ATPase GspE/PulE/Tfp pilus assembly ATPase PilB-like protein
VGDPKTSSVGQSATTHSVESLIAIAHKLGATDIHLDPKPAQVSVRLRIDGGLADYSPFESQDYATVVNRIKVLAGLDIAETHTPQDGKFQHAFDNERLEVRVSVLPSQFGQRVALRLLPRGQTPPSLSQLGFTPTQQVEIRNAYNLPGGLIIVAGPTGSGKSTALFSMMSELLGGRDRCGLTVEDPVEYEIPGATQVSLGGELQLSFATALRTMLRHDPDVLMVGEIRDAETAQIATQAAMTGHLVLSTVHTQNVHRVRTRLVDLGVEEYLLNETLRLAIAGRLEALACGDCAGVGCLYCAGTGRSGRVGRFETLQFQPEQRLLPEAGGV